MNDQLKDRVKAATGAEQEQPQQTTDVAAQDGQLAWLQGHATYFTDALPRHVDKAHFIATARSILPSLKNCTNASIIQALLACARFGLEPDGKQAAIIPYGKVATFQPMYQGYVDLMYRSGLIDSVHFGWIHEADQWDFIPSMPPPRDFVHKPAVELSKEERGPVILAYAFAWIKGGGRSQVIILNREDAEEIRDKFSKAYAQAERNNKRDSTWHEHFDAMWAKSAVLRLTKRVPKSPQLIELLKADEDAETAITGDVPTVARGTAPTAELPPPGTDDAFAGGPGQDGEQHAAWPEAAKPGSGAKGDDQ